MIENSGLGSRLRSLYQSSPSYKTVLDWLASKSRVWGETKVEYLSLRTQVSKNDIIQLFRKLEKLGAGKFLVGRRGHPSRFKWRVRQDQVGKIAQGIPGVELAEKPDSGDEELGAAENGWEEPAKSENDLELMETMFPIRRGKFIPVCVPRDMKRAEAQRLADYIKTLTFEEEE